MRKKLASHSFMNVGGPAVCVLAAFLGQSMHAATADSPSTSSTPQITGMSLVGQPVIVFDHLRDKQEPRNFPDAQSTAWKNADGTVNLTIPITEMYRMQGPDLEHLTMDTHKIFSSATQGMDVVENHYNSMRRRRHNTGPLSSATVGEIQVRFVFGHKR